MFSIFVGINKEEPTLEEDPQYFEAQLSGSAKTHKGVLTAALAMSRQEIHDWWKENWTIASCCAA